MYKVFDNIVQNSASVKRRCVSLYMNKIEGYNLSYEVCFDLLKSYLYPLFASCKAQTVL
jgi:hypothetical protein